MKEKYIKLNPFITMIVSVFIVLVLVIISYKFFIKSFEDLESQQNRKNISSILDIMNKKLSYIDAIINDYSKWDDTYNFINNKNDEYIYENFREGTNTLEDLKIDFLIFTNLKNEIIFTSTINNKYYKDNKHLVDNILDEYLQSKEFVTIYKENIKDNKDLSNNKFYLVKRAISNSDNSAKINGYIYAGKLISDSTFNSIKNIFNDVKINEDTYLNNDFTLHTQYLKNVKVKVAVNDSCSCLENTIQIYDHENNYSMSLITQNKRVLIQEGKSTIFYYNLIISIFVFIVLFLIFRNQRLLQTYNKELESKVNEAISTLREKDKLLFQQSKLASMGEMLGNIAHQWRQPLNVLSLLIQKVEIKYQTNSLDEKTLSEIVDKSKLLTNNMSETIEDFMNFFNPKQNDELFIIDDILEKTLNLFYARNNICKLNIFNNLTSKNKLKGSKNALIQVILNLLSNAFDSMKDKKECKIDLILKEDDKNLYILVKDYGLGIEKEIIERIFEPYFTTKFKSQGIGIGLYMSKMVIEENMKGSIIAQNDNDGATFKITIPYN
ncbi:hypothetical protein CRV01_06265 [Arcobacter sp. CECT 8983]|uniref:sensor histidine kinase n=1 Tax=Arcobacter sp. CECT 8983 TaxID=2044508 RepID=UPI00100B5D4B|nr:ATP-binding protein [Arcobacter sp. CECT 8983]RXJ90750.1 hypothetical protein CRV01_06265 [Arcobacter sp. CECT 8983]